MTKDEQNKLDQRAAEIYKSNFLPKLTRAGENSLTAIGITDVDKHFLAGIAFGRANPIKQVSDKSDEQLAESFASERYDPQGHIESAMPWSDCKDAVLFGMLKERELSASKPQRDFDAELQLLKDKNSRDVHELISLLKRTQIFPSYLQKPVYDDVDAAIKAFERGGKNG